MLYFFIIFFGLLVFSQNIFSEEKNILEGETSYLPQNQTNGNNIIEKNIANGFDFPINLITLNTAKDDFAPFYNYLNNELIFNSIYKGYSRYFVAKITPSFDFATPKLLPSMLNENRQNRSYFTLLDEKQALISAFNHTKRGSFLNIQKSIYERNAWSAPSPIPEFSDSCFIAHPTISPNGKTLVFASNKNNSLKKTDLWSASKQPDGSWSMMLPIDELNSNGNEITPFFVSNALLIFASDGFEGMGGFDLYYSFFASGRWSKPQPLEGVNTEFNESDPAVLPNGILIFASDKPGGRGKLDLYSANVITNENFDEQETPFTVSATNFYVEITKAVKYDLTVEQFNDKITTNNEIAFTVFPPQIQFFIRDDADLQDADLQKVGNANYENYVYEYKLSCGDRLLEKNRIDFSQKDFTVNLEAYSAYIFECDSLLLEISLVNTKTGNVNFARNVNIDIAKRENRELMKHQINNEEFYRVLTFFSTNINDYKEINKEILAKMQDLIFFSRKVNVLAANNLDKSFANELKKILNIRHNINIIKSFNLDEKYLEFQIFPNNFTRN